MPRRMAGERDHGDGAVTEDVAVTDHWLNARRPSEPWSKSAGISKEWRLYLPQRVQIRLADQQLCLSEHGRLAGMVPVIVT